MRALALAGAGLTMARESRVRQHIERGELVAVLEEYCTPFPGMYPVLPEATSCAASAPRLHRLPARQPAQVKQEALVNLVSDQISASSSRLRHRSQSGMHRSSRVQNFRP
jgi:hypothetical protein